MSEIQTQAKKATSQEILRLGMDGDFWQLIVSALQDSKENLRNLLDSDDLKDLPADQYKLESEILKSKIKYIDKLSELPKNLIAWHENPDNTEKDFDPYE